MGPRVHEEEYSITDDRGGDNLKLTPKDPEWKPMKQIVWLNVIWYLLLHIGACYGLYLTCTQAKWTTIIYTIILYQMSMFGITAGAHRLWTHRSYKATLPFQLLLLLCNTIAGQNSVYDWSRDHRAHHKYSETDADPHNSNRGFFFSHMGWLMSRKHPLVKACGRKIDMSDLKADLLVDFQRQYYLKLFILVSGLTSSIPALLWFESFSTSYWVCFVFRYTCSLHVTWLVNSAAHMWGYRPYDKSIASAENALVSMLASGEGHHNYHHTFPWDYSTSEWGWSLNSTTMFLDLVNKLGLIHDCKSVPKVTIDARCNRTGTKRDN